MANLDDRTVAIRGGTGELAWRAAHLFFQLVSRRYERGAILLTSNRSIGEWGTDRGDSYRLKEKRRSGLLQKPTAVEAKSEKKA
jgi:DNA replication protein DnaC